MVVSIVRENQVDLNVRNLDRTKACSVIEILILNFDNLNLHETITEIETPLNCIKVDDNNLVAENF